MFLYASIVPYIPYEVVVTASTKVGDGEAWMDLVYTLEGGMQMKLGLVWCKWLVKMR